MALLLTILAIAIASFTLGFSIADIRAEIAHRAARARVPSGWLAPIWGPAPEDSAEHSAPKPLQTKVTGGQARSGWSPIVATDNA